MRQIISDGVDLAYELGGSGYGELTETFYTALGLYDRDSQKPTASIAVVDIRLG